MGEGRNFAFKINVFGHFKRKVGEGVSVVGALRRLV